MGIADILDEMVELYKTSFTLLIGIAAVMHVPYSFFTQYYLMQLMPSMSVTQPADPTAVMKRLPALLGAIGISYLYLFIVTPVVTGALTIAISERYLGHSVTIGSCFRRVLKVKVFFPLLGLIFLKGIATSAPILIIGVLIGVMAVGAGAMGSTAGFVLVVMAGIVLFLGAIAAVIYLTLRLLLAEPSLIVESCGTMNALARSWTIMPGSIVKGLGLILLVGLISGMVPSIVSYPTRMVLAMGLVNGAGMNHLVLVVHSIITAMADTLVAPLISIASILLYYDIRIRKEGFDLMLLANEMGAKPPEGAYGVPVMPQEQPTMQYPQEVQQPYQEQVPPGDGRGGGIEQ